MAEGPDFKTLAIFFCKLFRVNDVWQINPRQGRRETWSLMSELQTLGVEVGSVMHAPSTPIRTFQFHLDQKPEEQAVRCPLAGDTPLCRFLNQPKGDTEHMALINVTTRGVWGNLPINMAVRFPFYHVAEGGKRAELDRLMHEAGAISGAYMDFAATPKDGRDVLHVPLQEQPGYGFLNRQAVATLALVNEDNLRNGIIPIPYEVCVAARLPVFRGPPPPPSHMEDKVEIWNEHWLKANADKHRIQMFYAVPINHVLSWAMRNEAYATKKRLPFLRFQFVPPPHAGMGKDPVLLYFLVADFHMDGLINEFRSVWLNKIDMRPLQSLSFDLIPETNRALYPQIAKETELVAGVCMVRSYLTYMTPEPGLTPQMLAELIPTLSGGFPEPGAWVPYDPDEVAAIQRLEGAQQERVVKRF